MMTLNWIASFLLTPLLWFLILLRFVSGKDSWSHTRNRLGLPTAAKTAPVVWCHAASMGELQAVKPLLQRMQNRFPGVQILVTTNNPTALQLAAGWNNIDLTLQAAPLDTPGEIARFLAYWQPVAFVNVESEFWPNRFGKLAANGVPILVVNARLSARSAKRLRIFGIGKPMLAGVGAFFCQDVASAENLHGLGVAQSRIHTIQNLKSLVSLETKHRDLPRLQTVFPHENTLLAASTHAGEEEVVLQAFIQAKARVPALQLILVPRHAKRGDEVAKLLEKLKLNTCRRSAGQWPDAQIDVYLVDTLGEMPLCYALASVTFVGGSLVAKGGHTPYEPAIFETAIISGPYLANFTLEYEKLAAAGGSILIKDSETLADAFVNLQDKEIRKRQVSQARKALLGAEKNTAVLDEILYSLPVLQGD